MAKEKNEQLKICANKQYLTVKDGVLYYKDLNCLDLVKQFGCPIKVGYVDIVKDKINCLKSDFEQAFQEVGYTGKYIYANANKASYYSENVITAGIYSDMIETSSYIDLRIVKRIFSKKVVEKKKIICNGVKDINYLNEIVDCVNCGYQMIFIVDNVSELNFLLNTNLTQNLEIGLRVNLENLYNSEKYMIVDRFGLNDVDLEYCLNNYSKNPKLILTTIHYHQRGSHYDEKKNLKNLSIAFEKYAICKKRVDTIVNLDIGGGCPYDKMGEIDYLEYARTMAQKIKELSSKLGAAEPNIIQENGRYTVSDSCFNIYKVHTVKAGNDGIKWYVINGSIMTSLINTWALGEQFLFVPINLHNNKLIKVRLAGDTCDNDDVYYYQNKEQYCVMPEIKDGEELYIGVFGMGAYQEILSGIGGFHHCLNLEENDLIVYKKKGKYVFYKIRGAQTERMVFKSLNYLKIKEMKRFKK